MSKYVTTIDQGRVSERYIALRAAGPKITTEDALRLMNFKPRVSKIAYLIGAALSTRDFTYRALIPTPTGWAAVR